jgi:hypothetical protein
MGQDQGVGSGLGGGGGFDRERMNRLKAVLTYSKLAGVYSSYECLGILASPLNAG